MQRQHLRFVEDDDAVRNVVQFAAAPRSWSAKRLSKNLHGGGDDDGRVPVFCGVAQFVAGVALLQFAVVEGAVMFQYRRLAEVAEGVAEAAAFCSMMLVNGMT